jgi:hypothetical protein
LPLISFVFPNRSETGPGIGAQNIFKIFETLVNVAAYTFIQSMNAAGLLLARFGFSAGIFRNINL